MVGIGNALPMPTDRSTRSVEGVPGAPLDPIDAVGLLADAYVKALLLESRGVDHSEIGRRLDIEPEAVPALLRIARSKLNELPSPSQADGRPAPPAV